MDPGSEHLIAVTSRAKANVDGFCGDLRRAEKKNDNERNWTIHAARMYAEKGGDNKPVVTDPGVLVTAQRDPNNKK